MGETVNPTGLCNQAGVRLQKKIEKILGTWLPDCAKISPMEGGGIRAEQSTSSNTVIKEIDGNGDVYFSNKCGEKWEGRYWDGWPGGVMCLSTKRGKQSYSIDPSKLAEARKLLLKEQKPEMPQPGATPAVVQSK